MGSPSSSKSHDSEESKWTRHHILVLLAMMLAQFCILSEYSLLSPFFPKKGAEKGLNSVTIGFLFATDQIVMFLMCPIYGLLIVKLGPRFLCVAGSLLCGICCCVFGLLGSTEPPFFTVSCFITKAIEGNGAAMFEVAAMTLLMKVLPASASTILGYIELVVGLGYIFGPVVGAGLYELGGYVTPFLVMGGLTVALSVVLYFILPTIEQSDKQTTNFLGLFRLPGVFILFMHCCVTCIAFTYLEPVLGPFMEETFGSTPGTIGLVFGAWSMMYAVTSLAFARIADRGYLYSTMIICLLGAALTQLFLAPSPIISAIVPTKPNFAIFVITAMVFGLFQAGIYLPPFQAILNLLVIEGYEDDTPTYGMITGMLNSAYSLGSFLGPIMSGYLTEKYGFAWATTIMTFLILGMCGLLSGYVYYMKVTKRRLTPNYDEDENNNSKTVISYKKLSSIDPDHNPDNISYTMESDDHLDSDDGSHVIRRPSVSRANRTNTAVV